MLKVEFPSTASKSVPCDGEAGVASEPRSAGYATPRDCRKRPGGQCSCSWSPAESRAARLRQEDRHGVVLGNAEPAEDGNGSAVRYGYVQIGGSVPPFSICTRASFDGLLGSSCIRCAALARAETPPIPWAERSAAWSRDPPPFRCRSAQGRMIQGLSLEGGLRLTNASVYPEESSGPPPRAPARRRPLSQARHRWMACLPPRAR